MGFKGRCLSFVDWNIFWHNIFPFHSLLPRESTNHDRNIHASAGLHNISCCNNSYRLSTFKHQQEKQFIEEAALSIKADQPTLKKRKCSINQLHLNTIKSFSCWRNVEHVQNNRLVCTKHNSPSNHGNKRISNLSCPTKTQVSSHCLIRISTNQERQVFTRPFVEITFNVPTVRLNM